MGLLPSEEPQNTQAVFFHLSDKPVRVLLISIAGVVVGVEVPVPFVAALPSGEAVVSTSCEAISISSQTRGNWIEETRGERRTSPG